ncbi:damage-inducible protein CinA [Rhizobium sp. Leaf384]|uniref:CinA family protein n=1 Tax=unclassified Rhizobium TaxID=2613769 RepID=UPI0007159E23|nr:MULTISPECIES: CinA family protein [unclassified Rhizobium]KQR67944.1 damage-inducible protein CinA [Rhizobium sp. Leaf341]KQS74464.1 damage-inducible protein CinA [Rhizobium sp. Leaf383]KQS80202.1 damage-inducible protein CinA [Rhizobium sp. Leaf384]
MTLWPDDIRQSAERLLERCAGRGWTIATAESCTGGLIAGALTEIPGSSRAVDRGFVTYSNRAKADMLGVTTATLEAFGAVSRETALEMVRGALARSDADIAVAVTGIAGPGGGSEEKPVGLVHIAAAWRGGAVLHRAMRYGDIGRDQVRLATVRTALDMLDQCVDQASAPV